MSTDARPEPAWFRYTGAIAAALTAGALLVVMGMILRHRIFVSSDTVSNYAHVWYVSRVLVDSHHVPYHMAIIGHGHGLAFPYAFVPWLSAALLRPWLGDWVVTLWLVLGAAGLVGATFWAFPELRRGWWFALVLADPVLVVALVLGQLPFLWAMAMVLAGVACWRSGHTVWAIVLTGAGQATHAAVALPITAVLVAGWWFWEPNRRRLVLAYAVSLVITAPAAVLVFLTPAYTDSTFGVRMVNFVETVAPRLLIVAIPVALVLLRRVVPPWLPPFFLALVVAISFVLATQHDTNTAWHDLSKDPDRSLVPFLESSTFRPGLEYRLLSTDDRRIGMYQLLQHGGRLDSEFFPESIVRRTWSSATDYCRFLRDRGVQRVVIDRHYDVAFRKNEQQLLTRLERDPSGCAGVGVTVRAAGTVNRFDVYSVVYHST